MLKAWTDGVAGKGDGRRDFFKKTILDRLFPESYCKAIFKDLHGQSEYCHRNK